MLYTVYYQCFTDGVDMNYYVKSANIIRLSQIAYAIPYTNIDAFGDSILNLSLPVRHLVNKVIGSVIEQARPTTSSGRSTPSTASSATQEGEGRAIPTPNSVTVTPLTNRVSFFENQCSFVSPSLIGIVSVLFFALLPNVFRKGAKVSLLRGVRRSGVTDMSGVRL